MAEYKRNIRTGGSHARPFMKNTFASSKELHDAECNSCHARCQVPFRPNGKKPVYCTNCFSKNETSRFQTPPFRNEPNMRPQRSHVAEVPNRELQDLKKEIQAMNVTLQNLVTTVDTFNRATALTLEIQKHFPSVPASVEKRTATKKPAGKAVKTASKKKAK